MRSRAEAARDWQAIVRTKITSFPDAFTIVIRYGVVGRARFSVGKHFKYHQCSNISMRSEMPEKSFCLGPKKLVTTRVQSH